MIKITYASFGQALPADLTGPQAILVWLLCAGFVVLATLATLILNFFALFTGTLILFLGRPSVEFRFLRLFGNFPAIGLALPTLLAFAIWHEAQRRGAVWALVQMMAIWLLGAAALAVCAAWGLLLTRGQPRR